MTLSLRPLLSLCAVAALASACDPFHGDLDIKDTSECSEVVTVLAGPDAMSPIGFTAAEVLAAVSGSHSAPIHWHEGIVHYGPESGQGELTVEVAYAGGEVRYVDSKSLYGGGEESLGCFDRLEIAAEVKVKTAGGALDESFITTLRAVRPDVAVLSQTIEIDAIQGSLKVASVEPAEGEAAPITLGLGIASFGLFGSFDGGVEVVSGDTAAYGFHNYATFPSAAPTCEFPFEAPVPHDVAWGSHSAADALALLTAAPASALHWGDDEATAVTFAASPAGDAACGRIAPDYEGGSLRFAVDLTMESADGRLDGALALEGRSEVDAEGSLIGLNFGSVAPYADVVAPADFEARFGVHGVDLSGYDGGGIDFTMRCTAESVDGNLTVLGATTHECSDEPGASCEGTDMTELVSGVWSSAG